MRFRPLLVGLLLVIFINPLWYFRLSPSLLPIPCQELIPTYLQALSYGSTTIDEIEKLMGIQPDVANLRRTYGDSSALSWRMNGTDMYNYTTHFLDDRLTSTNIYIDMDYHQPTGKNIIYCFGEPDFYISEHQLGIEHSIIVTDFWYIDKGMSIKSVMRGDKGFDEHSIFRHFTIMKPAAPEIMITKSAYLPKEASEREKRIKQLARKLKPWPGGWSQVEVTDCISPDSKCYE